MSDKIEQEFICPLCEAIDPVRRADSDKCPKCQCFLLSIKDYPEITGDMKVAACMRSEYELSKAEQPQQKAERAKVKDDE